jgi:hypothetical protein
MRPAIDRDRRDVASRIEASLLQRTSKLPVLMPPSSVRFSLTRLGDLPSASALLKMTTRSR